MDHKTRANAASALGNFARNGAQLSPELIAHQVPQALLALALQVLAAPTDGTPVRSRSLFAFTFTHSRSLKGLPSEGGGGHWKSDLEA